MIFINWLIVVLGQTFYFEKLQGVQKRRRKSKLLLCQKNLDSRGYLGVHFDHKNGTFDYLHQILLFFTLEHEIEVFD